MAKSSKAERNFGDDPDPGSAARSEAAKSHATPPQEWPTVRVELEVPVGVSVVAHIRIDLDTNETGGSPRDGVQVQETGDPVTAGVKTKEAGNPVTAGAKTKEMT